MFIGAPGLLSLPLRCLLPRPVLNRWTLRQRLQGMSQESFRELLRTVNLFKKVEIATRMKMLKASVNMMRMSRGNPPVTAASNEAAAVAAGEQREEAKREEGLGLRPTDYLTAEGFLSPKVQELERAIESKNTTKAAVLMKEGEKSSWWAQHAPSVADDGSDQTAQWKEFDEAELQGTQALDREGVQWRDFIHYPHLLVSEVMPYFGASSFPVFTLARNGAACCTVAKTTEVPACGAEQAAVLAHPACFGGWGDAPSFSPFYVWYRPCYHG